MFPLISHQRHLPRLQMRPGCGSFHRFDLFPTSTTSLACKSEPEVGYFVVSMCFTPKPPPSCANARCRWVISLVRPVSHQHHLPRLSFQPVSHLHHLPCVQREPEVVTVMHSTLTFICLFHILALASSQYALSLTDQQFEMIICQMHHFVYGIRCPFTCMLHCM